MRTQYDFEKMFKELGIAPAQNKRSSPEQFARGFEKCTVLKNTSVTYSSGANSYNSNMKIEATGTPLNL